MGSGQGSTVKMPPECQEALRISIDIFEVIDITELFCGWSLSSKSTLLYNETVLFTNSYYQNRLLFGSDTYVDIVKLSQYGRRFD